MEGFHTILQLTFLQSLPLRRRGLKERYAKDKIKTNIRIFTKHIDRTYILFTIYCEGSVL